MARFYYDAILGLVFWSFKEPIEHNYLKQKSIYVKFQMGKPKMKLRNYIHMKANNIAKVSMANAPVMRRIFIEAYNFEGIKGVEKIYSHTIKILNKNYKNV